MPGSKDFQNLQIGPRQVLLLAGMLIYDVAEHPTSRVRQSQKTNLENYKQFGNHIYRDIGMMGVIQMSDEEVKELLNECATVISSLKDKYGDAATARQKMSLDAARGACLLRIQWIDAGISHFKKNELTGAESIITIDNREIPHDPTKHDYLTLVSPRMEFEVIATDRLKKEDDEVEPESNTPSASEKKRFRNPFRKRDKKNKL
ncbi:MAG: hypothetical protein CMP22_08185 [Rickettsiales bacterium]|nr:hypothetical protein [Rickettsiales bacterium]|tara:strand:+ start:606 stop:1217 length:612 start_codon:yes stop_codon:yes gene_type:complete